jgi:phosphatidylglycerol---prolipoprotein diacylglyceryl transferase
MLVHPQFNPIAFEVGPLKVHWYGLMYMVAFLQLWWLGKIRLAMRPELGVTEKGLDDLLFFGVIGVVLGGRLGEVLFYQPGYYFEHPAEIIAVWNGGMSFHGGFIGVLIAMALWSRRHHVSWFNATDFIAPLVPLGLAAGRIGNFINGELWGRVADPSLPWAMLFPQAHSQDLAEAQQSPELMSQLVHYGALPRHPSQIYQALGEGLMLFIILWIYARKSRPTAAVSAVFLIGYGAFRFIAEYFREPDAGIFGQSYLVSMGQWLSLPMIVIGIIMLVWAYRRK